MTATTENTVMNYDPNIQWAVQTVRVTLGSWKYRATFTYEMGGNCKGFSVMGEHNITEAILEQLAEARSADLDDEYAHLHFTMTDPDGNEMRCEPDQENLDNWIAGMVIAVEIIDIRKDTDK